MDIAELRMTVFESAADNIRASRNTWACGALKAVHASDEELQFFEEKYRPSEESIFWFGHVPYGPERQKAREEALRRCVELIRRARAKKKTKKLKGKTK